MSYEERMEKMGLNDYRADVIMPAIEIFLTAARRCRIDEIIVPKIGLVDGIIHQLYRQNL
jgi:exopolyphosphatase/guanosine-5'-triphosphate,3'-diphosphate pyrophosphatase